MIQFSTSPQERDYILETISKEPHQDYEIAEYGPSTGTLTISMPDRPVALHTHLSDGQIASLKQCQYVGIGFVRVGDNLGLRVRTA